MRTHDSSRRTFIWTAGAALSVPVAAAAAHLPGAAADLEDPRVRLAMLREVDAIRALNRAFARHVNAGTTDALGALFVDRGDAILDSGIAAIVADGFGEHDVIEVAADRQSATARVHCGVQIERAIEPSCTLEEMARAQGGGVLRRTERMVFEHAYVKRDGVWKIRRSAYRPV